MNAAVMYFLIVLPLTLLLPAGFVVAQAMSGGHPDIWLLVGKWWVFWAGGIRLLIAGLRQIVQPAFTAKAIFEIHSEEACVVVRELGFANVAVGLLGTLTLAFPSWLVPAALTSGLFYALAGSCHALENKPRNAVRIAAMATDFIVAAAMTAFLLGRFF